MGVLGARVAQVPVLYLVLYKVRGLPPLLMVGDGGWVPGPTSVATKLPVVVSTPPFRMP